MLATVLMLQVIGGIQMPPARFDHSYHGRMSIVWKDYPYLVSKCRNIHAAACAIHSKGRCVIIINQGYRGTWAEKLYIRHERAHCNGWSARHER